MLNLQQDLREKQTQQKEESGKLSAVTVVLNSPSSVMGEGFSTLVQEELVIIIIIIIYNNYVCGKFSKQDEDNFHEGLNSDCHALLIYKDILMTEEQIKAHHNFFIRRYNIDADPVE